MADQNNILNNLQYNNLATAINNRGIPSRIFHGLNTENVDIFLLEFAAHANFYNFIEDQKKIALCFSLRDAALVWLKT